MFLLSGQSWRVVKTTQRGVMVTRIAGGGVAAQFTAGRSNLPAGRIVAPHASLKTVDILCSNFSGFVFILFLDPQKTIIQIAQRLPEAVSTGTVLA